MSERFGLINVAKPPGMTSRDVVNRVQRWLKPAKVGHAGTLDPLATGVLVLCVGQATRLIEYVQAMRKRYVGTFLLGRQSPTEDVDGPVTELADPPQPTLAELHHAATQFIGVIQQRPPAFSAVKVAGRRAYALARAGETVDLAPRPVEIYGLEIVEYAYPRLVLSIECGSGTYVRTLGRDLAQRVGTDTVMLALERTAIGDFTLDSAVPLDTLTAENWTDFLLPAGRAVVALPSLTLNAEEATRIAHGLTIPCPEELTIPCPNESSPAETPTVEFAAFDSTGRLVAILIPRAGGLGPVRNFFAPQ